jgi:hypothetical protein
MPAVYLFTQKQTLAALRESASDKHVSDHFIEGLIEFLLLHQIALELSVIFALYSRL